MKQNKSAATVLLAGISWLALAVDAFGQAIPPAPPATPTQPAPGVADPTPRPLERGQRVTERPRPELDPLGVRLGTFVLFPRVELDEIYNDNIFATDGDEEEDFITVLSPQAELRSNWGTHALNLRAGLSAGHYLDNDDENFLDYTAGAEGRYDISRTLALLGLLRYDHLHEERDSPDSPSASVADEPVEYDAITATLGVAQRGLRIGYAADVGWRNENYDDVGATGGGTIDQDTRDVNVYSTSLRVSYEIAPRYEAFVRGGVNRRVYDNNVGLDRDSWGYRADAGVTIDLTGVTFAELFVGYLTQEYDDDVLDSIDGIDFGANVVWNVTQLTSVTFLAERRVQDSNTTALSSAGLPITSPGYLRSRFGATVDHELLRNVLLRGRLSYEIDEYEGIDREDDRYDIEAGVRYLLNRNFYVGASYTFTERESEGFNATGEFSRNLFMLRLGAQL